MKTVMVVLALSAPMLAQNLPDAPRKSAVSFSALPQFSTTTKSQTFSESWPPGRQRTLPLVTLPQTVNAACMAHLKHSPSSKERRLWQGASLFNQFFHLSVTF